MEFLLNALEESLQEAIRAERDVETPGKTPDRIVALFSESPRLSMPELAARLGKSESAVERAVRKLHESGRLQRVGPDKGALEGAGSIRTQGAPLIAFSPKLNANPHCWSRLRA